MLKHADKGKDSYYEIVQMLVNGMKKKVNDKDMYAELKETLSENMESKAKYLIQKIKDKIEINDPDQLLKDILNKTTFTQHEIQNLSKLVVLSDELKLQIKSLKSVPVYDLLPLLTDDSAYNTYISQLSTSKPKLQSNQPQISNAQLPSQLE